MDHTAPELSTNHPQLAGRLISPSPSDPIPEADAKHSKSRQAVESDQEAAAVVHPIDSTSDRAGIMVTKVGADDHIEADLELSGANRNLDSGGDSDPKAAAAADAPQTVSFFKLFEFADSLDRVLLLLGTAAAIANGLTFPFMTLLFGQIIDAFGKNAAYSETVQREVAKVSLLFVYLGVGALVASSVQVTSWMVSGERQASRIRALYLKAMLRQDVTFFDKETTTGEVIGRLSGDTILIHEAIGEKLGQFIQFFSTFVGGFLVAFIKGWKLTLVLLAAIPFMIAVGASLNILITRASSKGQQAYAQAGDVVEQAIGAIRTVAAFTGERKAIDAYNLKLKDTYKAFVLQGLGSGLGLGAFMITFFSSYALAIYFGSKLIVSEGYSGGIILNVLLAILIGSMYLGQASPSVTAFAAGRAAAYKMFEVIHRVPEIDIYDTKGQVIDDLKGEIEFTDVDFAYPMRPEVKVFSGFSIRIEHGTTVALVGESGSGKSTVISLIERFYDPQGGVISLDGVDIRQLQLRWLRFQIGLVSQEPVLFGTSIRDNIAYGKDDATPDEIQQAAILANAFTFISQLPQGLETLVGEHGTQLSGGQKQRVAIARAILKNPRVLLLDEATSALDAESERIVQDALDRVMAGRTTVVVAHRLSTVRNADTIAVVQHGAIVESGKHDELLHNSSVGAYSQLIKLQQMQYSAAEQQEEEEGEGEEHRRRRSSNLPAKDQRRSSSKISSDHHRHHHHSKRSDAQDSNYSSKRYDDEDAISETAGVFAMDSSLPKRKLLGLFTLGLAHGGKDKGGGGAEDPELAEKKRDPEVSILRLAALNKPEAHVLFLGSIAAIGNGLIFPLYALMLSSVLAIFYEPAAKLRKDADFWAIIFLVLGVGSFVVLTVQMLCFAVAGGRLVERVRSMTFEKVLQQETAWFDDSRNSSGAVSARLSADAAHVKTIVGDTLALAVRNVATIIASLAIAFSANWILSLVVLAVVPLLGLEGFVRVKFLKGFSADAKVMYEDASQVAADAVGSIRTVASFCAEGKVMELYNDKCKFPLQKGIRQGFVSGAAFGFSNFVMYASYALCFWFGGKLVKEGKAEFQEVFKAFFAITLGAMSISNSTILLGDLSNARPAVNSVFALLDRRSKINPFDTSGVVPKSIVGKIEFERVSFRYPTRPTVQILNGFSLSVKAGKTVALVGESGCGKSTVIALLERFYDPDAGRIFVDGVDVKDLQLKWLRQQIGLVGQEPVLFNSTIRDNILYGSTRSAGGSTESWEEEMIAAAHAANAHKFIAELPDGYDTSVGPRGIQLSGGQKQRVAIARAIIRDPRILLLDEATSALDAESEHVVQEALERVMLGRSVIVVAHRLSTIQNASLIAVMKRGVVVEQGRHDELLLRSDGGEYAALVKLHAGVAKP